MDTRFKNTDFFIENIDESVKDLTVNDSSVSHLPANTDFFIENIDNNVIEICTDRGITPTTVSVVPANTDFFIVNIDSNVKKIATDLSITPSSVEKVPANTEFFIENIYSNIILICIKLNIDPSEINVSFANTDFFIEAIAKNVEKIMEAQTEIHVSGTFIHAVLSADSKISDYELDGNATQDGTPTPDAPVPISTVTGEQTVGVVGKNLFDGSTRTLGAPSSTDYINTTKRLFDLSTFVTGLTRNNYYSQTNVSAILNDDGSFTISATQGYYGISFPFRLVAGTYTFSAIRSGTLSIITMSIYADDGTYLTTQLSEGNAITFTLTEDANVLLGIMPESATTITASNIQLELGSTASEYTPFQGQTQKINLGKNLLTPRTGATQNGMTGTVNADGSIHITGTATAGWANIVAITNEYLPSGTYTFSTSNDNLPCSIECQLQMTDNSWLTMNNRPIGVTPLNPTRTYTLPIKTIRINTASMTIGDSYDFTIYPMIEAGFQVRPSFAPYFTPIELAKIGTYQDRIYKNDGKWYIEKQVGKVVLDGSSDENWTGTDNYYTTIIKALVAECPQTAQTLGLSQYFLVTGYNHMTANNLYFHPNRNLQIDNPNKSYYASLADWKNWLSTHPTTIYYALATPTTTEITDETLLAQLNAIYDAELKEGVLNISIIATSPNLPATLKATIIPKE